MTNTLAAMMMASRARLLPFLWIASCWAGGKSWRVNRVEWLAAAGALRRIAVPHWSAAAMPRARSALVEFYDAGVGDDEPDLSGQ